MAEEGQLTEGLVEDLPPIPDRLIGQVLGDRYKVLRRLGTGGMGSVYEAEHTLIGRRFALKVLHAQFATDAGAVRRFLNEARAAGVLGHPNIIESTDMGRAADGSPFLVLELLDGNDLQAELEARGPLPIGRAVRIALQVASALQAAHARGIVHRDLKPHNIYLTKRDGVADHVKVLDFGISKFSGPLHSAGTHSGAILGTPCYMAPEQMIDASKADARADIYALGTVLYHMLSGGVPFDASSFPLLVTKVLSDEAVPLRELRPDVPEALAQLVAQSMAKSHDRRMASMEDLGRSLEPFRDLNGAPVTTAAATEASMHSSGTQAPTLDSRSFAGARPRRVPWMQIALAGLVVMVIGSVVVLSASPAPETTPAASASPRPDALTSARPMPLSPAKGPVASPPAVSPTPAVASPAPSAPATVPSAPEEIALEIESPAPRARATIRGETHDLPLATTLAKSTEPETIEVVAPGRQGRRFRLSLDAPRHLTVALPVGRGVVDASAAELQAALAGAPAAVARRDRRDHAPIEAAAPPAAAAPPQVTPPPPAPVVAAPPPNPPAHAPPGPSGVYTGPRGDIDDALPAHP